MSLARQAGQSHPAAWVVVRRIGDFAGTYSITKLSLGSLASRKAMCHECYPLSMAAASGKPPRGFRAARHDVAPTASGAHDADAQARPGPAEIAICVRV